MSLNQNIFHGQLYDHETGPTPFIEGVPRRFSPLEGAQIDLVHKSAYFQIIAVFLESRDLICFIKIQSLVLRNFITTRFNIK